MRLKSIKLAGFKSFVDATTVSFPHNMTAIVGPNGCGKSNVIDAVRWVMGESSAKNLRGESMTDVIFNGSTARQPVGQASIELVFDNAQGKLSGEYAAFSEISIRRKVTREGVSQYYLNGAKCRRRDVTDIFLGTGMGPRSYAIIEQGMISRLIESKPEELRVYLEEAAGISKYKERRRETENRIARTRENLERLSDIRDELGKQLAHLQRQAKAAEKYKEYKQDERDWNAKANALEWQRLNNSASVLHAEIVKAETAIEKSVLGRTENESRIEQLRIDHEEKQDAFSQVQARYYESGAEIAKLEQEIKFRRERVQQRTSALAKLALERATLNDRIRSTQEELDESEGLADNILPELELQQERLDEANELLAQGSMQLELWQGEWEQFEQNYQQLIRTRSSASDKYEQLQSQITQKKARIERLEREQEELSALIEDSETQLLWEQLAKLEAEEERFTDELDEQQRLLDRSRGLQEELRENKASLQRAISEHNAVLASLKTLQASMLRQDETSDLEHLRDQGIDTSQRLYSKIRVDSDWEAAVEHVLGDLLRAITCEERFVDAELIASLQASRSFIHLGGEVDPVPGTLAEKVTGETGLYGILNRVYLAIDSSEAMKLLADLKEDQSVITADGHWYGKRWTRVFKPAPESVGLVSREEEISRTQDLVVDLEERLEACEVELASVQSSLTQAEQAQRSLQSNVREVGAARAKLAAQKSAQDARDEQRSLRLKQSTEELDELRQVLAQEVEQAEIERLQAEETRFQVEEKAFEREQLLERKREIQARNDGLSQDVRRLQSETHALQLAKQEKLSQKNILEMSLKRLQEDLARVTEEHEETAATDEGDEQVEELSAQLESMLDARLRVEEQLAAVRAELEHYAVALKESEQKRMQFESEIQTQRTALEQQRMQRQALEINKKTAQEKLEQDNYVLSAVIETLSEQLTAADIQEELARLATKIQRLGAINLAAVDEYKEQSERKTYLDAQDEELNEALETLLAAIRKIDKETRARFKETYDQVNEGLQRLFPRIFGGGSAYLELTDNDLLETGVAIIARPPGKKNSTIHLLSGGEKALTAIALIFAIFELNPAPFCMLDEVDAPLDDANVGRFANMVKEMSDRVQFIYISHNKVSMEKADQLMGVTMSEPGVSRLVSVDVEEAVSLAEA